MAGFQLGDEYETTYAYDDSGRLERVIGPGLEGTYGAKYDRLVSEEKGSEAIFNKTSIRP